MTNPFQYIVVEGPIGVGKTSLASIMANDFKARLVLEEAAENPFLGSFYENPAHYAFQAQLFFLLSRYRQQQEIRQGDLLQPTMVSDYCFAKDRIFASLNLTEEEQELYNNIYTLLDARLSKPDVVIFLQASPEVLMSRIHKRKAPFEKGIREDYVQTVAEAYSRFFFQYTDTPLLVVNTSGTDFINNRDDYEMLKRELYHMLDNGIQKHYVTIDTR